MAFRVGQKVVCIADDWAITDERVPRRPVAGQVYTIRRIRLRPWDRPSPTGFCFFEIVNPEGQFNDGFDEPHFGSIWFRPLVERKTELPASITALLDPKNCPPMPVEKEPTMTGG